MGVLRPVPRIRNRPTIAHGIPPAGTAGVELTHGRPFGHHRRPTSTSSAMQPNVLADPSLAPEGHRKIDWVRRNMPILRQIEQRFAAERPFAGLRITVCIHL